jgi:hypothetical protein
MLQRIFAVALAAALLCLLVILPIHGSGALTETTPSRTGRITTYDMTVTTASTGKASLITTYSIGAPLLQALILPGSDTNEPSNLFDVQVLDQYDRDVLVGEGLNLDPNYNKAIVPLIDSQLVILDGALTVDVNNAGAYKTVRLVLMYEERQ